MVWEDGKLVGQNHQVTLTKGAIIEPANYLGSGRLEAAPTEMTSHSQTKTIQVASNTGFTIESLDPTQIITARVVAQGPNAQNASTVSGAGTLFVQTTKTAARQGTPISQALAIELTWTGAQTPALIVRAN